MWLLLQCNVDLFCYGLDLVRENEDGDVIYSVGSSKMRFTTR